MRNLKLFFPAIVWVGIIALIFAFQPVKAAPPADAPNNVTQGKSAQDSGVTLDKRASAELVVLGHPVTFTIRINNDSGATVTPKLVDTLPDILDGLALQTKSVTATVGAASAENNTVLWTGTLESGQEAVISYAAIPPSTSAADKTLKNVAVLEVNGVTQEASVSVTTQSANLGMWGGFVNFVGIALVFFDKGLVSLGVPYAFGFAIILFTIVVRLATFPLNMQQIKSSKAMQELQPQLKELQDKYKNDREKLAQAQMQLYRDAGVNPLGGCLPMLVQMPIWFALYQALIHLSNEGLLNEGFFWIPSLSGPASEWGGTLGWLWPLPPAIGWAHALAYLVMPVLLVVSQFYMQNLMTPPTTDPQQAQMQSMMKFMPLMFGWFALVVPSGLTLYWFTSNILGVAQHYFTKTQIDQKPAEAKKPALSAVSVEPAEVTSEESNNQNDAKSRRKPRRKR